MITRFEDLPKSANMFELMKVLHESLPKLQNEIEKAVTPLCAGYDAKKKDDLFYELNEAYFCIEFELEKCLIDNISRRKEYRIE